MSRVVLPVKRARRNLNPVPFPLVCQSHGIPRPTPEYRFDSVRRFRFDWAWPDRKVALEVDGGVWTRGRHTRGAGFIRDQHKMNLAASQGWKVFRCTPDTLHVSYLLDMLKAALEPERP